MVAWLEGGSGRAESFEAFGVREAVLVAKHGCGYVTWPSKATLPDGSEYNYSVAHSTWRGGKGDVLGDFKTSCLKKGSESSNGLPQPSQPCRLDTEPLVPTVGVGYYYSLGSNNYVQSASPRVPRSVAHIVLDV